MSKNGNIKNDKENYYRRFRKIPQSLKAPLQELDGNIERLVYQGKRNFSLRDEDEDFEEFELGTSKRNKNEEQLETGRGLSREVETIPNGSPVAQ